MNNEQQQIIDEVYKSYHSQTIINSKDLKDFEELDGMDLGTGEWKKVHRQYAPKEFINKCKTDPEFSERWGLKIEERELSLDEKEWQLEKTNCINDIENDRIIYGHEWEKYIQEQYEGIQSNQGINIPTKLITITYKEQTIESYE